MRWPISCSVGVSSSSSRKRSACVTDSCENAWIELAADRDGQHLGLEPGAVALGAGAHPHVLLDPLPLLRRVGLAVAALQVRDEALERHRVLALAAHAVPVGDEDPIAVGAEQEPVLLLALELAPRAVEVDLVAVGDGLDDGLVEAAVRDAPRHERALRDRERRVGHEQVGIDLELRAEAGAARAGAVRRVEREDARLELGQRDAVLGAGEVLGEEQRVAVDDVDGDEALGQCRGGLDRLRQPLAQVRLHHEAVDDDLDLVLELLVEGDLVLEQPLLAVDLDAREAVAAELLEHVRNSPLRSRTTGALTVNRVPSGSASTCSTIWSRLCPAIGRPQTGQCGRPTRAYSRRR